MFDYTPAKLYDAGKDLTKVWYVYFSVRGPDGKLIVRKRKQGLNRGKTVKDRIRRASLVITAINNLLKNGWRDHLTSDQSGYLTLKQHLEQMNDQKKATMKWRTWQSYKYCLDKFFKWLEERNLNEISAGDFTVIMANQYIDHLHKQELAPKTFNYNKETVKHFFTMLEDREIIVKNPFRKIRSLPVTPRRHVAFTNDQLKVVDKHMKENCYQMYLFTRFVLYCFIRPIEVLNIEVGQVDQKNWRIMIYGDQAKTREARVAVIPKPLQVLIKKMKLESYPKNFKLFGHGMVPSEKALSRNAVTENFRRWVKVPLGLSVDQTLYGYKFTGNARAADLGISIDAIRRQNGHTTELQTRTYLRSIGRNPNDEFSSKMK